MDTVLQFSFALAILIVGFLLTSFILWYRAKRFVDRSHRASGVVIKVKKIPFENRDTYSPVVRFTTGDGRALSFTDPVSRYPPEFKIGERADVLYDPQDPHKARALKNPSDLFFVAKLFGTVGAALLAVGFVIGAAFGVSQYVLGRF